MTRTLAFVAGEDWNFLSHRLGLALAAQKNGWQVVVIVPPGQQGDSIRRHGFILETVPMSRNLKGLPGDMGAAWKIAQLCRHHRVDLIHAFALKPVLLTAIAARLADGFGGGAPRLVGTVAGLGYMFINHTLKARLLRFGVTHVFGWLLNRPGVGVIVQNQDDQKVVGDNIVDPQRLCLVRGSGVNMQDFPAMPEPATRPLLAALPARMLWDKGVGELVEAARQLRRDKVPVRIALVGDSDPANPRCIAPDQLRAWADEGIIEWWGHKKDMVSVWQQAHLAVLPSYREGLPKALLEAASCGRALITTNAPGCRELVEHEANGLLVPVRDSAALAAAIRRLVEDEPLRHRLAAEALRRIHTQFCDTIVHEGILGLYQRLLSA